MSECFQLIISKIKHIKLKESPEVGPHNRVEPANRFPVDSW